MIDQLYGCRRSFVAAFVFGALALLSRPASAQPVADRPNILFIMTDDHSANAISCYGSAVNQTPNLDRLANQGVRFDRCFATNSICSPSRATILTGKYSHLNGVRAFDKFDGSQPTVAKELQAAGYYTGIIGKWHLVSDPTGFDVWNILPGQGLYYDPVFYDANKREKVKGYATDLITDRAIEFLKDRPKDKPFFLMCHHKAPHRPFQPDEKHRAMFADKTFPEPATLWDDYSTRTDGLKQNAMSIARDMTRNDLKLEPPANLSADEKATWLAVAPKEVEITIKGEKKLLTGDDLIRWKYQRYMQDYLACVASVDDNVGRLVDWLDANGLRDNTIVIYTSDQGFFIGEHGLFDKRYMYEPSIQMPFLVRWPGVVKPGTVERAMTTNVDFAETFLDAAGAKVPDDMQGRSLVPVLKGQIPADWRTSFYYRYYIAGGEHNTAGHYGIRTEMHKLIYYYTKDQWELYDLVADPNELHNLYGDPKQAELIKSLKTQLEQLKRDVKDNDPTTAPATVPTTAPVNPS
jgi:arylsulfatase A-like enzyme